MVARPWENVAIRDPGNSVDLIFGYEVLNQSVVRAAIGLKLCGVPQRSRVAVRLQECFSVRSAFEQHSEVAVEVGVDQLGRGGGGSSPRRRSRQGGWHRGGGG